MDLNQENISKSECRTVHLKDHVMDCRIGNVETTIKTDDIVIKPIIIEGKWADISDDEF